MNLKDFAEPGDQITNFGTGERYMVPTPDDETVKVTWVTHAVITYTATIRADDYRAALAGDEFDLFMADQEDSGAEVRYEATERDIVAEVWEGDNK